MDSKSGTRYGAILLEMFSIILAIVLGFAVTRWSEVRSDRQRAASAVLRIGRELQANQAELQEVIPYYRGLSASVDSLIQADGDSIFAGLGSRPIPGWHGLSTPTLRTASFTVATSAGAFEHVASDEADAIASAYELIEDVGTVTDDLIGAVINGNLQRLSSLGLGLTVLRELSEEANSAIAQALEELEAAGS